MYAPKIITSNLELEQEHLPFILQYSSISKVETYSSHLSSLINRDRWREKRELEFLDPERQQRYAEGLDPLEPDERQWVVNEKLICTFDYLYFATRYAWIDDWKGRGLIRYSPSIAQLILNDIRAEMEAQFLPICLFQLKARQMGISTDNQVVLAHRILFYPDTHVMTASSDPEKTSKIHAKLELVLEHIPWYLFPAREKWDERKTGEERITCKGEHRISVTLQHGTQASGISRGDTIKCAHLTEMEDWDKPKEDIDSSLIKAIHFNPETYFCMEFTAKMVGGYMFEKWQRAEEYFPQGKYRFRPFFLPWYIARDIYPMEAEVRQFFEPVRHTWMPQPLTIAQALRAEENVRNNPFYQKYLGKNWKMPVEQMWFWEWDREQAKMDKRLGEWTSEMPSSADEAWQVGGTSIFDTELIHELRQHAKQPLAAFEITGTDITPRMRPEGIQYDREMPFIPVTFASNKFKGEYALLPILVKDWQTFNPRGKLMVWAFPEEDEDYYVILDSALGTEQDNLVFDVFRRGDAQRPDEQVAQFASNLIGGADASPIALAICSWYAVLWNGQQLRYPLFVPELAKGGAACMNDMRHKGWPSQRIYVHISLKAKVQDRSKTATLGWVTNVNTRDDALGEFIKAVRERAEYQQLQINSRWTIGEMSTFGINPRKRKLEALGGANDDRVMTAAIGNYAMHAFEHRGRSGESASDRRRKQMEQQQAQIVSYDLGAMGRVPMNVERHIRLQRGDDIGADGVNYSQMTRDMEEAGENGGYLDEY